MRAPRADRGPCLCRCTPAFTVRDHGRCNSWNSNSPSPNWRRRSRSCDSSATTRESTSREEIARLRGEEPVADDQHLRQPDALAGRAARAASAAAVHARLHADGLHGFHELHGDRMYSGRCCPRCARLARLDGAPVMLIGQQKGRDTKERVRATTACRSRRAIARRCG